MYKIGCKLWPRGYLITTKLLFQRECRPWLTAGSHPRRAGSSAHTSHNHPTQTEEHSIITKPTTTLQGFTKNISKKGSTSAVLSSLHWISSNNYTEYSPQSGYILFPPNSGRRECCCDRKQ
jgi:hypothetical protein